MKRNLQRRHKSLAKAVAEDQQQIDKVVALKQQLPRLETVLYYDPHGLAGYPGHQWDVG